jgi:nitrate/TMAO reductase-like tetraheme cytochrome c subunit
MTEPSENQQPIETKKAPSRFRNFISFIGLAIVVSTITSIVLLFAIEQTAGHDNPYLGIFTYIVFPSIMMFGLFIMVVGALIEWRRRIKHAGAIGRAYPTIDLNDPKLRRSVLALTALSFFFILVSAFGSFRAYEHTESVAFCGQTCHTVMKPEFVAYQASPHARVRCVDCHVGPGAEWYVRSKLSGLYQVYSVAFNKFSRPIATPIHSLRPARDTCEQCHWPEKFFGSQLKVINHYGYDRQNTLRQVRMLINTGGGSPTVGLVQGIHWHMYISNEVTYIATDERRQVIPWVQFKDSSGKVTEYMAKGSTLSQEEIAKATRRKVDCVDCHNRPSHIYVPPDKAVNEAFVAGRLDPSIPFLKREAVLALSKTYNTTDEAVKSIASSLDGYYRSNHADIYQQKADAIKTAISEVQRIYQTYIFPEMKVNWKTHPDNISHYYFQGCFRCHDGEHFSKDGKVIRKDCNICHTVLDQTDGANIIKPSDGSFTHPGNLGNLAEKSCMACHTGDTGFQHPVALGDLSEFKCADCHKEKVTLLKPQPTAKLH